jgi:hypothetical protein
VLPRYKEAALLLQLDLSLARALARSPAMDMN